MIVTAYTLRAGQTVRKVGDRTAPFRTVAAVERTGDKYHVRFADGTQTPAHRHTAWEKEGDAS
jgi:hypothetical protein